MSKPTRIKLIVTDDGNKTLASFVISGWTYGGTRIFANYVLNKAHDNKAIIQCELNELDLELNEVKIERSK